MTWDRLSSTHLDSIGVHPHAQQGPHIPTLSAPGESRLQDTSIISALMHTMYVKTIGGKAFRGSTAAEYE
jgi:hypothetical protein